MNKITLVATILILVSYKCHSLNTSEIKTNDLITNHKTEDKLYQSELRNQYFHEKMNNSSDNSINELVWSEKKYNRQEKFLQGIDREDNSNKITLSIPFS